MTMTRLLSATALATLIVATPVFAQSTAPSTTAPTSGADRPVTGIEGAEESNEAIVVTGSRIPRAGFDTLEPAAVVSAEYLETRGLTNVADALNEIPGFGVGVNPDGNQAGFGVGQNFVSRFGLGSARTLTLVNGRRFVSTNAPSLFGNTPGLQVDLNVIPSELVDRIENLAIGGAPTYGSDAIAGTVNVILKRNYDGVSIQALGGVTSRGDNGRYNASILAGQNFAGGRGNITAAVSYDKATGVLGSSRTPFQRGIGTGTNPLVGSGNATIPGRTPANDGRINPGVPYNTGNTDGIANSVYIYNTRIFGTSFAGLLIPGTGAINNANGLPSGFGAGGNTLLTFDANGNLVPYNAGIPFGTQNASGGDGANIVGETQQITSDNVRVTGNLIANYELTTGVNAFFEGTYYFAKGKELIDQSIYNSSLFGGLSAPLLFQANDPRLTAQARTTLASLGVTSFRLSRASRDLVNNNASGETNVYRGVAGLNGDFKVGGRKFTYEVSANYGTSRSYFQSAVLNQQNFVNAINNCVVAGVTAANNVAPGGVLPIADAACVPLDVFGEGRPSAAAKRYVTSTTTAQAVISQEVYSANVAGSPFTLWAGDVGISLGYERRIERGRFNPDAFQRAGLGRSVAIGPNSGSFSTNEFAGELLIPLVSAANNIPLIETLQVEGKGRYVKNTVNGGFWAYTFGGRYRPVKDIEFRGNYTRSLRAPSIVELFTPQSPAFNTFPDPCDSTLITSGTAPATRAKNCAAFYASYGLNGTTFQSAARTATVPIVSGGSPTLANEQGRSYTFGVVLRPTFIPRFRVAVDWNRIKVTGNIASLTPANIAEGCYDNPNFNAADVDNANPFCTLIRRDRSTDPARNGQLSNTATRPALVSNFVNGAFIEFKGLTAEAEYNFPLTSIGLPDGRIDLSGSLFYLETLRQSNNAVTITENQKTLGNPELSGQFNIGFTNKSFGFDFQGNYQTSAQFSRTNTVENLDILGVRDYWVFNSSVTLKIQKDSIMRFSVSNVFDRDPPFPLAGNGLGVYDYLGRRFTVSINHKF